mmetsp:Transcript_6698/g.9471  ORF Transcript_6698/g.9471 Transcript_6698/m.9471 type:complete len:551 (-) Transcript_6698:175-1827(-)
MISTANGNNGCCTSIVITEGQLGLGYKNGRTHFVPPGNYIRLGYQVNFERIVEEETQNNVGTKFSHQDISYINLPENHVAVVQGETNQYTLVAGRYIIQKPIRVYGICNVQNLKNKVYTKAITESPAIGIYPDGCPKDKHTQVSLKAGEFQQIGSLTFVRAEPGFGYVVQASNGNLRYGVGFGLIRGGEVYKEFVDMHHHARSTRWFKMESKDRQEVKVRVQLRWKIRDPVRWTRRKGTNSDIFQAVEENIQALVLESVTGHTYEHCMIEAGRGFSGFEKVMRPRLQKHIESLGGTLLGFEIRDIRFPLLHSRNKDRAKKEAQVQETILEEKRKKEIEDAKRVRKEAARAFQMIVSQKEKTHKTNLYSLQSQREVKKQEVESKLAEMVAEAEAKTQEIVLTARKREQEISQQIALLEANGVNERKQIMEKAKADERLLRAKADAQCEKVVAEAKAKALLVEAKAKARSAELLGTAYKANEGYVHLIKAVINKEILRKRGNALAEALSVNKAALMPEKLQRELAMVQKGFSPIAPVAFQNGQIMPAVGSTR